MLSCKGVLPSLSLAQFCCHYFNFLFYFIFNKNLIVIYRRSSIGTFIRPHSSEGNHPTNKQVKPAPPKLDYRSMVSIEDMPELFVSFDSKYLKFFY